MRELFPLLPKPSRYLGIEEGSVHKRPEDVRLRVSLVFPDMYEVGMSYLGQKILYGILNSHDGWQAERVFTPCRDAGAILREHHAPLCTMESDTPLAETDVIGFSVTHELCYSNILYVLDLAGVPLRTKDRKTPRPDGKAWPLVIAGGGCTLSAEPIAPFMDVMLLGEGEAVVPEVIAAVDRAKQAQTPRQELLLELSRIPGVYVPEFFEETDGGKAVRPLQSGHAPARRIIPDMDKAEYPVSQAIPFGAVHNRLALEIGRGCTRGCRFCQAGNLYRPARERSVENLQNLLDSCLTETGFDDVSFLSLSTGDYSSLKRLFMGTVDRCVSEQISVSLPSLRVGSIDDAIMGRIAGIRRTGATLAPEAGSQRLRNVINKGVTEEGLILHVQKLFEHGWQQVKLYFMIGLPTETDDDLLAIIDLCRKARDAAGPGIKRLQVTAAISPFVPKPHTPFQWEAQISLAEIRRRVGVLLDAVKKEKRIKLRWHEPEMSFLEGIFSRGDRRLADVVETAYKNGEIFTSWIEGFSLDTWLDAMKEHGLSPEEYTGERDKERPLSWDHLESGLSKEFLLREWKKAAAEKTTEDCRYSSCQLCGVCDTKAGASRLDRLTASGAPAAPEAPCDSAASTETPEQVEPATYRNILNSPQRDQEAHTVSLDEYGRVIVRNEEKNPGKPAPGQQQKKARPPELPPHLIKKADQLRFRYARKGSAAYLSQLEIQHIFDRALRRAGAPICFSQGFHPLPLVSFGRALPVGVASEDEWFSIYLREERSLKDLLEAMNAALPKGLRILSVESLPLKEKAADAPDERFRLEYIGPEDKRRAFADAWAEIAAKDTLPWEKEGKKGVRTLDARPYFAKIDCNAEGLCLLDINWANGYSSPLVLCRYALESAGFPAPLTEIRLTKLASGK